MTRLDGEKKSPLPWIIGLIVLALLAAGIYYFTTANRGADQNLNNGVQTPVVAPGDLGDNSADANTVDSNMADANSVDANAATANMADANAMDANSVDSNAMDSNSAMTNGADTNAVAGNSADANSADMGVGNSETVTGVPVPAVTPASADANAKVGNDTMVTRSKTIKTDDKTVIYEKSVKADGSLVRDKKIVPNPVVEAKKQ